VVPIGIAGVTALVFAGSLACGFVWDDDFNLLGGADFRGFGARQLRWMFTTAYMGHYHPFTWLSFALDHRLHGIDPWGYHLTNVLLHAGNAVLVYFLLCVLLERGGGGRPRDAMLAAAIGALVFALHPLRVESVTWVTERRGLLSAAFCLVSVLAYVRAEGAGRRPRRWLGVSLAAFALALLSKESAMGLPVVLLVLDWYPLGRAGAGRWRAAVIGKAPWAVLAGLGAGGAAPAPPPPRAGGALGEHGVGARLVQAFYGVGFYVWKTLVPVGLAPLYPFESFRPGTAAVRALAGGALVWTVAVLAGARRWPAVAAAWSCYLLLLAPVLGLAQSGIQVAADRYTYLAIVPLVALLAAGIERLLDRPIGRRLLVPVAAVALIALAGLTRRQIPVWTDARTLWGRVVALYPDSQNAWHNLALGRLAAGDARGALADLDRALALDPAFAQAYNTRGTAREALHDLAGARADLDRAVALAPQWVDPYNNRGNVRLASGDVAGALSDYDRVLALAPGHVRGRYNRAVARERQHDVPGALADMDAVIAASPDYAYAYAMRARYRAALGNVAGAAADLERALALLPAGSADARTVEGYRAELRSRLGEAAR
jgi:tetratricopeptide (TPR) repeat protein